MNGGKPSWLLFPLVLILAGAAYAAGEGPVGTQEIVRAPGWTKLEFEPPPVGTYQLPALRPAADGEVLVTENDTASLHSLFGDRIVLLNFMYSSCQDINGCPLATAVFYQVKKRLSKEGWGDRVKLISLSFDPQNDTPEVMRLYGAGFDQAGVPWDFVTTAGSQQLQSLLDGYDQRILREVDEQGNELSTFAHILRVYLVDPAKRIRNIYSVSFLHADVLVNDIKTVWMGNRKIRVADASQSVAPGPTLSRPGDDKTGYESAEYQTRSIRLDERAGEPADLLSFVERPPLGLPKVSVPEDNPITREKVALGRKLFFDRRLSLNDTFSCAMCHVPEQGFAHNELATAVGIEGRTVRRNAPTMYNVAYLERLFHDGREYSLENQVWAPLLAKNEMGNPSVGAVLEKLKHMPDYAGLFERAFGRGPSMETVGMALASYGRTLNSANSPFDKWRFGENEGVMDDAALRGFELFTGNGRCVTCHVIDTDHALFTDHKLHNTGVGYTASMSRSALGGRKVLIAPGVEIEVAVGAVQETERQPSDLGLYEVTQNPDDRWKYRTPSLRNVALTAPYMHDGSLPTLRTVVEFYNRGGVPNELLDPLIRPLGLNDSEVADLVEFLRSLTGGNVDTLISDAFAAPVGDINKEDPHWSHENRIQYGAH
ncbi:MAG: SCO family protein [Gammaproteobacteria bacterium]|nr:SCO family protein [Gammaproteobacteria bacterium]